MPLARIALLAALLALAWIFLTGDGRRDAAALDPVGADAAARDGDAPAELDAVSRETGRSEAGAGAPVGARPGQSPDVGAPHSPPVRQADEVALGSLRLEAVDGATAAQLGALTLRTWPLLEGPSGEREGGSPLTVEHPAGRFKGSVFAPGHDPASVPPFEVAAGETTDLGRFTLHRGGGAVTGVVRAGPAAALRALTVELHGQGRSPCASCATEEDARCRSCGFAAPYSALDVAPDESFGFERLAAGRYDLVVKGSAGRVVAARRIDLEPLEEKHVEIDLDLLELVVETVTADGAPFDGWWLEGAEVFSATMRFHLWLDDVLMAAADVAPEREVEIEAYLEAAGATGPAARRAARSGAGAAHEGVDPEEGRYPEAYARPPGLSATPSSATRLAPGRFRLEGVPRRATHVQVTVGPFITTHVALEPVRAPDEPVRIVVDRRCGFESKVLRAAASTRCTSCHSLQELAGG